MADAVRVDDRVVFARVARLATADASGRPHVVPVTFALVDDRIVSVVDSKPKSSRRLKRLANIEANPAVSLLVDHYDDGDWSALWWARVDGRAWLAGEGPQLESGIGALRAKYPQYGATVSIDGPLIVIDIERVSHWSAQP